MALGNLLAVSSGSSPLEELPHARRLELTADFGTLGAFALDGDAVALAALGTLAGSGSAFSGGARVFIENRGRLAAIARTADAIEFGRRYITLGDEIVEGVRARLVTGDDPAWRETFLMDASLGLLEPLRVIFRGRFRDDRSVEVGSIRHNIIDGLAHTMALLATAGSRTVERAIDAVVTSVTGDDLHAEAFRAIRYSRAFADGMGVALRYGVPRGLRFREGFDPTFVLLALGELVWNAVKYHDFRKVDAFADVKPDRFVRLSWDAARGVFIVDDNGSGIERPERAFEPGYREAARYEEERSGIGMGLTNIRRYLDKIGWRIEVESEVDVGTRFIITPKAGDVVEGTPPQAPALGSSFGGVVETGGSKSGGEGEGAASAEPLEDSDPAAVMGAETMIGADAVSAAIVGVPPPPTLVK